MTVFDVAKCLNTKKFAEAFDMQTISGVAIDAKDVKYNYLYIPLNLSGKQRVKETGRAIAKGASAILWESGVPGEPEDFAIIYVEDLQVAHGKILSGCCFSE